MSSKRRNSACIFCYKAVKSSPKNAVQNVNQLLQFFSRHHFKISQDSDPPAPGDNLSVPEKELVSCDKCFQLGESFSELYSQFENLKVKLNLKIKSILDTMSYAEKVPSRLNKFQSQFDNIDDCHYDEVLSHIQKLREDLIKSCEKELKLNSSQSLPQANLKINFDNQNDEKIENEMKTELVDDEEEFETETKNQNEKKPARKSLRSLFKCSQCQNTFPTYERLKVHMKFHEEFEMGADKETSLENLKQKRNFEGETGEDEEIMGIEEEFDIISDQDALEALKAVVTDEIEVEEAKPSFKCRTCSQFFPTQGKLRLHNFHTHKRSRILKSRQKLMKKPPIILKTQPEIQSKPIFQGIWSCPSCPAEFYEPEKFALHEVNEHGENPKEKNNEKSFQCTRCECSFKWRRNIIKHFLQTHLKIKPKIYQNKPTIIAATSTSKNLQGISETDQDSRQILTCTICQIPFRLRSLLSTHMDLVHHHQIIFDCQFCPKKLKSQESFKMHLGYQHGKVFPNSSQLLQEENVKVYYIPKAEAINLNNEWPKSSKLTEVNLAENSAPIKKASSVSSSLSSSSLLSIPPPSHSKPETLKKKKESIRMPIPIQNIKLNQPKKTYKCAACQIVYNASNKFFYHMLQAHGKVFKIRKTGQSSQDELENQYVCPETSCNFRCSSKRALLEHIKEHSDRLAPQIKVEPLERTPIKMELADGKDEESTLSLDYNLKESTPDVPVISQTFSLVEFLPPLSPFPAATAIASSTAPSSSQISLKTTTKVPKKKKLQQNQSIPKYQCDFPNCSKEFNNLTHFNIHQRYHTGEKPYPCEWEGCSWKFAKRGDLIRHSKTHTGQRSFQCPVCEFSFARSDALVSHISRQHHGEEEGEIDAGIPVLNPELDPLGDEEIEFEQKIPVLSFNCSFCPFKTGELGDLEKHLEVSHVKSKSKGISLSSKKSSSTHQNLNQNGDEIPLEKQFKCDVEGCNKFFGKSKQLRGHRLRMHADDKPFHCSWEGCSMKFAISHDCQRHYKTHVAEKKYQCSICERGFARVDNFNRHMKMHEGAGVQVQPE